MIDSDQVIEVQLHRNECPQCLARQLQPETRQAFFRIGTLQANGGCDTCSYVETPEHLRSQQ